MKRCLILLVLTLVSYLGKSQNDFEGYVEYHGWDPNRTFILDSVKRAPDDNLPDQIIRIYFSPGRIRAESTRRGKETETVIVLLESGMTYKIEDDKRKYYARPLEETIQLPPHAREMIAGFWATPVVENAEQSIFRGQRSVFWYADSLFFHIPERYDGNDELLMVKDNRIMLKGIVLTKGYSSADRMDPDTATFLAHEIRYVVNRPELFQVPADYDSEETFTGVTVEDIKEDKKADVLPPPPPPPPKTSVEKKKRNKKELRKAGDNQ